MIAAKEYPMPALFRECAAALRITARPWHYKSLTRLALTQLGEDVTGRAFEKNAENVREKMLQKGAYGTCYTGRPLCLGGLTHWFTTGQSRIAAEVLDTPLSPATCLNAGIEAVLRPMVQHNPFASAQTLATVKVRGLALEWHWATWFQGNYPEFFAQPDNRKHYDRPCNHDFKLIVDGRPYTVDIAGPDKNGVHGLRGSKPTADIHLLCRMTADHCEWDGVVYGRYFSRELSAAHILSPTGLLVWLNCHRHGLDYLAVKHSASRMEVAA